MLTYLLKIAHYLMSTILMLDTIRRIETPEGIELELRVAGPVIRAGAWGIDFLLRLTIVILFFQILNFFSNVGYGLMMILYFFLEWFYSVYFEVFRNGMTPGKKVMKIKVIHDDGTPVGFASSLIRNLLRFVDLFPFMYATGVLCTLLQKDFKRVGDLAAGTLVIYHDTLVKQTYHPILQPEAPVYPLSIEEQKAIIYFAERAQSLTHERKYELANLLQPLTQTTDEKAVVKLYQYANWLQGQR